MLNSNPDPDNRVSIPILVNIVPVVFQIWILICTDLMGRGMDFKGINLVINYDFPPTAISYIHRIGKRILTSHVEYIYEMVGWHILDMFQKL